MKVYNSITELVGNTPLVRLNRLTEGLPGEILVKLEYFNPMGSVKDRIGLAMIEAAEKEGILKPGSVIVEATSGNTGIALAFVGAARGYRVILTMPDTMSAERRKLLTSLGAELILTPGSEGMNGAVSEAERIARQNNGFLTRQFKNPSNPAVHRKTTAEEIWRDTGGTVDVFVAAVGTGGTVTGAGSRLKELREDIQIFAVEPAESPVLSGGEKGSHKIQGIGPGFIPDVLDTEVYDGVLTVDSEDAAETTRLLAEKEGIFGGISSGANVRAALDLAEKDEYKEKRIVTVVCDTGERYLSTWLWEK
ncbi:MAG: cysteine synthase A [Spirochaetia bacterium]